MNKNLLVAAFLSAIVCMGKPTHSMQEPHISHLRSHHKFHQTTDPRENIEKIIVLSNIFKKGKDITEEEIKLIHSQKHYINKLIKHRVDFYSFKETKWLPVLEELELFNSAYKILLSLELSNMNEYIKDEAEKSIKLQQKILSSNGSDIPEIVDLLMEHDFLDPDHFSEEEEADIDPEQFLEILKYGYTENSIEKMIKYDEIENFTSIPNIEDIIKSYKPRFYRGVDSSIYPHSSNFEYPDETMLNLAALHGSIRCFKFLLLNGEEITQQTCENAVKSGDNEIIRICTHQSPETSNYFCNLLEFAIRLHRNEVANWILTNYVTEPLDFEVILISNNMEMFLQLLDTGFDVNKSIKKGNIDRYPIDIALASSNIEVVKLLIKLGADVKKGSYRSSHVTDNSSPLRIEASSLHVLIREYAGQLQEEGLSPGYKKLLSSEFTEIAEILIENGAEVNKKDQKGNTPLRLARKSKDQNLIKLLRQYGAK